MNRDTEIYFSSIIFNGYQDGFWNGLYPELTEGGKFMIEMGRSMGRRVGVWKEDGKDAFHFILSHFPSNTAP